MISITCTQCHTVLTIDDAFAGGACRCQHCGTIQTVPSRLKGGATPQPHANPPSTKTKALYKNQTIGARTGSGIANAASPSGLDELANAVATSSGLGSGLQSPILKSKPAPAAKPKPPVAKNRPPAAAPPAAETPAKKKLPVIPIAIGVAFLGLIAVIVFLVMDRGGGIGTSAAGGGGASSTGGTFCGTPIEGSKIIYVLDDANSIAGDFDTLKAATYASINSLGSSHKFAVMLWNNGEDFTFPRDGLADANTEQVNLLRDKLKDTQAAGASRIRSALERAMGRNPVAIVIVTGKAHFDSDGDDEAAIAAARESGAGKVKFYAFTVGSPGENQFLKMTAESTGGSYRQLSSHDLNAASP